MSSGVLKNRTFKNEKNRGEEESFPNTEPVDPRMKAEMHEIMQAHNDARGPSLIEQHREKKAEERMLEKSKGKNQ